MNEFSHKTELEEDELLVLEDEELLEDEDVE
jgi:hypothetical protein